ncbi:MAG TPA: class I SAM-dependent methyltransferase [Alphaproteobacteria bacterium]|nr:class I SAM-dependent methyltransferase [Alphaproteobacteria bacterium]
MTTRNDFVEANRQCWDEAAEFHRRHPQYAALLRGFRNPGFSCLDETATTWLTRVGIEGRDVAQLCCNNGRELLSVRNMGAGRCVGFDQSAAFLSQARELAAVGGIDCTFVETDVHAIGPEFDAAFDIVVVTIGVFGWMPDLDAFLAVVSRLLRPGGRFFVYEEHPILNMVDLDIHSSPATLRFSYFKGEPFVDTDGLDYWSGRPYPSKPCYWFPHPLGKIVTGCVEKGLAIERLEEFSHNISEKSFLEKQDAQLPLSYLLIARKEGEAPPRRA